MNNSYDYYRPCLVFVDLPVLDETAEGAEVRIESIPKLALISSIRLS